MNWVKDCGSDGAELLVGLSRLCERTGFYDGEVRILDPLPDIDATFSTQTKAWLARYFENKLWLRDRLQDLVGVEDLPVVLTRGLSPGFHSIWTTGDVAGRRSVPALMFPDTVVIPGRSSGLRFATILFDPSGPSRDKKVRERLHCTYLAACEMHERMVKPMLRRHAPGLSYDTLGLTVREIECLRLLLRGRALAEVADALGISRRSVDSYLQSARERTGSRSTIQLIGLALSQGLIDFDAGDFRPQQASRCIAQPA